MNGYLEKNETDIPSILSEYTLYKPHICIYIPFLPILLFLIARRSPQH